MYLVLIKSFTYSFETINATDILEANNIEYYLHESVMSNIYPSIGQSSNIIKLFVKKSDEAEAIKLLIEAGIITTSDVDLNLPLKNIGKTIQISFIIMFAIALLLLLIYLVATK